MPLKRTSSQPTCDLVSFLPTAIGAATSSSAHPLPWRRLSLRYPSWYDRTAAERIRPIARPWPPPAPHLASSSLSHAPSSAPHPSRPGKPGPFAQELFVLSLHVSEFWPPSSSCQRTTKTGSIYPVFSKSAAFLQRLSSIGLPRSLGFGEDEPLLLLEILHV